MEKTHIEALEQFGIKLDVNKIAIFDKYMELFLEKNSRVNLISKNDEKFLFEKHVFDSLAITKFLKPKNGATLLDFGTGGGFPSVPIAIFYGEDSALQRESRLGIPAQQQQGVLQVTALDSIRKKINVIEELKIELSLTNLTPICERVEKIEEQFDYVTSRAVASMDMILKYALPKMKENGYFIAYKSKKAMEEMKEAKSTIKKYGLKIVDTIEYTLPLDETFERNLIVFKR